MFDKVNSVFHRKILSNDLKHDLVCGINKQVVYIVVHSVLRSVPRGI